MKKSLLAVLMLVSLTINAQAEELEDSFFEDFNGLAAILRAKGVEPSRVNWTPINSACIVFKDAVRNNRCKYDFAINQRNFEKDQDYCNAQANQQYFDYIKPDNKVNVVVNTANSKAAYIQDRNYLSKFGKQRFLTDTYRICMRDIGWNDPDNFVSGRRDN